MADNVIKIVDYIRRNNAEAHAAILRACERPLPNGAKTSNSDIADWLIKGLWLEGYKIVPCIPDDDDNGDDVG